MEKESPRVLKLNKINDCKDDVNILIVNSYEEVNMVAKRFYFLVSGNRQAVRGNHAHINQSQILMLIKGNAKLTLTDKNNVIYKFDIDKNPIYIPSGFWIEVIMQPFTEILCLASEAYKKTITLNNKSTFLNEPT